MLYLYINFKQINSLIAVTNPQSLFEKLWQLHEISDLGGNERLLNIDRIFLHERTGSIALLSLEQSGREVVSPNNVFCTMDHIVSTQPGRSDRTEMPGGEQFITATRESAHKAGITLFDLGDPDQGIAHVISPELGIAQPGITLICPDSHTCTLGALGALAWGVGSTAAEHALATKALRVSKPQTMRVHFSGSLSLGVTAKDMILYLINVIGTSGGSGYAVEFSGSAIKTLPMEARFTLCNMAVEFSAFTSLISPDQITFNYVKGRRYAPTGDHWGQALNHWETLHSDEGALFDAEIYIDCSDIKPTVTWGTSPQDATSIDSVIPDPDQSPQYDESRREAMRKALNYMALTPNTKLTDIKIDAAFIGSCTNSRLSDLRSVANFIKGKHIASGVSAICVPGSSAVKRAAEAEGIDRVLIEAGFEWRESGCSMCFYAGGETFGPQKRVISSTNRNFEGRQGPGTRTHLASPLTVAASACAGYIAEAIHE
jgi:3-isopropylmalate/(R)-2-methylmalate dehydratase large subunit